MTVCTLCDVTKHWCILLEGYLFHYFCVTHFFVNRCKTTFCDLCAVICVL
eukprot:m.1661664 g.1661664  ORF g.1661664 m.1661664 type:complete len:50 (+) comp126233_c0_seq1:1-150(+)